MATPGPALTDEKTKIIDRIWEIAEELQEDPWDYEELGEELACLALRLKQL
jgi:hypothetical protein